MRVRAILLAFLVLFVSSTAYAQVRAYESITIATTAIGISAAVLLPAPFTAPITACSGRLETGQVRFRFDGVDPTSSEGVLLEIGESVNIASNLDATRIRFIRTGAVSGTLKIHCWR